MSTIKADTLSNVAGSQSVPVATVAQGSAKAWVNFNGTGTVAIRASFNVSSITDASTGNYTVNFTTAMQDVNYVCQVVGYDLASGASAIRAEPYRTATTSAQPLVGINAAGTAFIDLDQMHVAIFR